MESKAVVSLTNGKKAFGNNEVLKDISLTVNAGDVLAIIGPSGGGKSTLLRCMTLLETLDSGDLSYGDLTVCANDAAGRAVYGGKDVIAAAKTRFGLVFQNFNLFPHYTVLQNVTDALICVQKMPKDEALARGAVRPIRRSAAACGHRPGHGHEPGRAVLRRAHERVGSGVDPRGAEGHPRSGGRAHDHGHCHP